MPRAVILDEPHDPPPALDPLLEAPKEPHPEFARIIHDAVRWCSKCRAQFSGLSRIRRVQLFVAHQGRSPFTLTWADTPTACPHCERTEWVEERSKVDRENSTRRTRHSKEHARWAVRERAREGIVPGRGRRAVRLDG